MTLGAAHQDVAPRLRVTCLMKFRSGAKWLLACGVRDCVAAAALRSNADGSEAAICRSKVGGRVPAGRKRTIVESGHANRHVQVLGQRVQDGQNV